MESNEIAKTPLQILITWTRLIKFKPPPPRSPPLPKKDSIDHNNRKNYQKNDDGGDKRMIAFQTKCYTSLKDLLIPDSPTFKDIPIFKDPLLQHAAWAYLQPMEAKRDDEDAPWWKALRDKFRGLFGCFNDLVSALLLKST